MSDRATGGPVTRLHHHAVTGEAIFALDSIQGQGRRTGTHCVRRTRIWRHTMRLIVSNFWKPHIRTLWFSFTRSRIKQLSRSQYHKDQDFNFQAYPSIWWIHTFSSPYEMMLRFLVNLIGSCDFCNDRTVELRTPDIDRWNPSFTYYTIYSCSSLLAEGGCCSGADACKVELVEVEVEVWSAKILRWKPCRVDWSATLKPVHPPRSIPLQGDVVLQTKLCQSWAQPPWNGFQQTCGQAQVFHAFWQM